MAHSTADSNRDLLLVPEHKMLKEHDVARDVDVGDVLEIRINGETLSTIRIFKPMHIDRVKLYDIQNDRGFRRGVGLELGRKKFS